MVHDARQVGRYGKVMMFHTFSLRLSLSLHITVSVFTWNRRSPTGGSAYGMALKLKYFVPRGVVVCIPRICPTLARTTTLDPSWLALARLIVGIVRRWRSKVVITVVIVTTEDEVKDRVREGDFPA